MPANHWKPLDETTDTIQATLRDHIEAADASDSLAVSDFIERSRDGETYTLVELPPDIITQWDIAHDQSLRLSLRHTQGQPHLAVSPVPTATGYSPRRTDVKLTSNRYLELPATVVRTLGLEGRIAWVEADTQLVGRISSYNDGYMLYSVANYYADQQLPSVDGQTDTLDFTTLQHSAHAAIAHDPTTPCSLTTVDGEVRQYLPPTLAGEGGETYSLALFDDGSRFLMGLLPHTRANPFVQESTTPFAGQPESYLSTLPTGVLSYEDDAVTIQTDGTETPYFTVPAPIADALWLDDEYHTDWAQLGDLLVSRLVPQDEQQTRHRVAATDFPTAAH